MTSGQNGEVGVQVGKLWGFRASELNGWMAESRAENNSGLTKTIRIRQNNLYHHRVS